MILGKPFSRFSSVLPTFRVGYHAGKPIESENERFNNNKPLGSIE